MLESCSQIDLADTLLALLIELGDTQQALVELEASTRDGDMKVATTNIPELLPEITKSIAASQWLLVSLVARIEGKQEQSPIRTALALARKLEK